MRRFLELIEQKENVVFTFGRFNPPTTGHEKLIQKVASTAGSSPFRIYPSYSQNQKKDPLPFPLKIAYMRKMYPKYARNIIADKDAKTAINIATKLHDEGFKNVTMVVGSDRVNEFSSLLKKYNGVEGKRHGFYKFDNINVVSAGERDPDAEGVEGMSASKMRAAASDGDFDSFSKGLPSGFKDGKKLYTDVRKHMGIREERDMGEMNDFETLRDMYLTGKIWNVGDMVEANGFEGKIIRKGTNYLSFNDSKGKVHKAWLHEVNISENPMLLYKIAKTASKINPSTAAGVATAVGQGITKAKDYVSQKLSKKKKVDEMTGINVPELIKTTIHRLTHPKGYKDLIQKYIEKVKQTGGKQSNGAILSDLGHQMGFDRIKPLQMYVNGLVKKGRLPQALAAEYEVDEEKIRRVKQDPDIKGDPGTEPAKYYKDVAKSKKRARDDHFEKGAKMDDDNPAAYTPAPGDKDAKTKPSKHTKKFKQMYGEVREEPCCDDCAEKNESLWANIHKKRQRIKQGSGEKMRKKGEKGAPTPAQMQRAKSEELNSWGEITEKDDKSGKELNNPTRGDVKKYKVYVKNDKGNVVKVEFGDPNMSIKRDDPARRRSFRARHNCENPGPKWKARYWSCKFWSTKSVTDLMKG